MTQEQINGALANYKQMIGRCGHIDIEVERLQKSIARAHECYTRDLASPGISHITGMPRGGAMGRPTEQAALSLAEGEGFERSFYGAQARECEHQIRELRAELDEKRMLIAYVQSWLEGLTERERWVIERHIIEREIWYDIIPQFNARFVDNITRDRLKRLQKQALERIYAMAA